MSDAIKYYDLIRILLLYSYLITLYADRGVVASSRRLAKSIFPVPAKHIYGIQADMSV